MYFYKFQYGCQVSGGVIFLHQLVQDQGGARQFMKSSVGIACQKNSTILI